MASDAASVAQSKQRMVFVSFSLIAFVPAGREAPHSRQAPAFRIFICFMRMRFASLHGPNLLVDAYCALVPRLPHLALKGSAARWRVHGSGPFGIEPS